MTRDRIRIGQWHQQVTIDPSASAVPNELVGSIIDAVDDMRHGYQIRRQNVDLVDAERGFATAGLAKVLFYKRFFEGQDVALGIGPLLAPGPTASPTMILGRANPHVYSLLRARRGVIEHALNDVDTAYLLHQIIVAYPELRIRVATKSDTDAERLYGLLREQGASVAFATRSCTIGVPARVVIASLGGLTLTEVNGDAADILIFADATLAFGERTQSILIDSPLPRIFGLLRTGCRLPPLMQQRLMCTFGAEKIVVPRLGYWLRGVGVAWLQFSTRVDASLRIRDPGKCLRELSWRLGHRNRMITRVARAAMRGNTAELSTLMPGTLGLSDRRPGWVLVVAADVRQAYELRERLPAAHLHVLGQADPERPRELPMILHQFGPSGCMIATVGAMQGLNLSSYDTIVWAGGGPHALAMPESSLIVDASVDRPLLLIDVDNRHHPQLRRWRRQRGEAYNEREWFDFGVEPEIARSWQFLLQHAR